MAITDITISAPTTMATNNTVALTTTAIVEEASPIEGGWELVAPDDVSLNEFNYTGPSDPDALEGLPVEDGNITISSPGTYGGWDRTGSVVIESDDVILENFILRGGGKVAFVGCDNVIVRNFEIHDGIGPDFFGTGIGVLAGQGATNCVVEDGSLYRPGDGAVWGTMTCRRLYFEDCEGDLFRMNGSPCLMEYCYVNLVGIPSSSEKHADGWHSFGIDNAIVRYNRFVPGTHTGINSSANFDVSNSNNLIEYNYFGPSPSYALYGYANGTGTVQHNRWGRGSGGGPVYPGGWSNVTWTDNAYLDNDEVINRP